MQGQTSRTHGFTIIELLVIVVVIGILAGVAIIAYGSWRQRVAESTLRSDLLGVASAMETARNSSETGYPTALPTSFSASEGITLSYASGDSRSFCINGVSRVAGTRSYFIRSSQPPVRVTQGVCS